MAVADNEPGSYGSEPLTEADYDRVEQALQDPAIGRALDYYGMFPDGTNHGQGVKIENGDLSNTQLLRFAGSESMVTLINAADEQSRLGGYWHRGKGLVFKIREPNSTTYVVHYQIFGSSRPDVDTFISIPPKPEYASLISEIDARPALLASNIPKLFPEMPESKIPEELEIVTPIVSDLTTVYQQRIGN